MTSIEYDQEYGSPLAVDQTPAVEPLGIDGITEMAIKDMADFGNAIGDGLQAVGEAIVTLYNSYTYEGRHQFNPQYVAKETMPIPILDAVETGLRHFVDEHSTAPAGNYETTGHLVGRNVHKFGATVVDLVHPHRHETPEPAKLAS
ncbi:MAG TPA: hypothetical protein VH144_00465 [Candidatus Saccharimonadales bacterium]|jgi:hypothetical protein|nr:hypothetical protein [Candidatus Saccharimonadales bacterium]